MAKKPVQSNVELGPEETIPVLPLRDIVVFPHMIVPLFVGREKSIRALEEVMREEKRILLVAQKNPGDDDPAIDTIYDVGTVAQVMQLLKLPDGTVKVLVEGIDRAKVIDFTAKPEYFEARVALMPAPKTFSKETEGLARSTAQQFESYVKLNKKVPQEVLAGLGQITDYAKLADTIAAHLALKIADKQQMLELATVDERLEKAFALMEGEISVLRLKSASVAASSARWRRPSANII